MFKKEPVQKGMKLRVQKRVTEKDTSLNFGSGKIERLLATPPLVGYAIEVGSDMIDPLLLEGLVSVGRHVEIDHFKPTCLGATFTLEMTVASVEDDTIGLEFDVFDEHGKVATGKHIRKIVNYNSLLNRASKRDASVEKDG